MMRAWSVTPLLPQWSRLEVPGAVVPSYVPCFCERGSVTERAPHAVGVGSRFDG